MQMTVPCPSFDPFRILLMDTVVPHELKVWFTHQSDFATHNRATVLPVETKHIEMTFPIQKEVLFQFKKNREYFSFIDN